jgi:hypothetical protein
VARIITNNSQHKQSEPKEAQHAPRLKSALDKTTRTHTRL